MKLHATTHPPTGRTNLMIAFMSVKQKSIDHNMNNNNISEKKTTTGTGRKQAPNDLVMTSS